MGVRVGPKKSFDSVLKSREITLLIKVQIVKAMAFPVVRSEEHNV